MRKNIVFYKGKTQFENLGDLLINRTLIDLVSVYAKVIVDDAEMPEEYSQRLLSNLDNVVRISELDKEKEYNRFFYKTVFGNIFSQSRNIFVLENPGHHFSNAKSPHSPDFKEVLKKKFLNVFGCKYLRLGATLGPYSEKVFKFQAAASKNYHKILVRDYKSLASLHKYNFKHFDYMPDLAWVYDKMESADISTNSIRETDSKTYIVLSFRDCLDGKKRDDAYFTKLLSAIKIIFEAFKSIKFVLTYQVEYDRAACKLIYSKFKQDYDLEFIDEMLTINKAKYIYSNAEFVVSNRLHVLMLAIESKTLPIALTDTQKHFKLVGMFEDEKMDECVVGIGAFDINRIKMAYNDKAVINDEFGKIHIKNSRLIKNKIQEIFIDKR